MIYRIEEVESKFIIGMNFYGDPFSVGGSWSVDNAIGMLWKRFIAYYTNKSNLISNRVNDDVMYECHIMDDEFENTGEYGVMVGVEVTELKDQPIHLVSKSIPKSSYIVLELTGQEIVSDQGVFIKEVLKEMVDVSVNMSYFFEKYDHRFKGMDNIEESTVEIYIPITYKVSTNE